MKANMMHYHIYLYHGNKYNYHCVITQTLQNGQTLGQFFGLLYIISDIYNGRKDGTHLEILSNFMDKTLEREFMNEELSRFLVTMNFTEGNGSGVEAMRLLHTTLRNNSMMDKVTVDQ